MSDTERAEVNAYLNQKWFGSGSTGAGLVDVLPTSTAMSIKDELPLPASFALTRQGLLMAYDYYEIASYADGVISYTIPYSKLKGILKPEFILSE